MRSDTNWTPPPPPPPDRDPESQLTELVQDTTALRVQDAKIHTQQDERERERERWGARERERDGGRERERENILSYTHSYDKRDWDDLKAGSPGEY